MTLGEILFVVGWTWCAIFNVVDYVAWERSGEHEAADGNLSLFVLALCVFAAPGITATGLYMKFRKERK